MPRSKIEGDPRPCTPPSHGATLVPSRGPGRTSAMIRAPLAAVTLFASALAVLAGCGSKRDISYVGGGSSTGTGSGTIGGSGSGSGDGGSAPNGTFFKADGHYDAPP